MTLIERLRADNDWLRLGSQPTADAIMADAANEIERLQIALTKSDMRAFGASAFACYKWPNDTTEHKALRAAYIEGAADFGGDPR